MHFGNNYNAKRAYVMYNEEYRTANNHNINSFSINNLLVYFMSSFKLKLLISITNLINQQDIIKRTTMLNKISSFHYHYFVLLVFYILMLIQMPTIVQSYIIPPTNVKHINDQTSKTNIISSNKNSLLNLHISRVKRQYYEDSYYGSYYGWYVKY